MFPGQQIELQNDKILFLRFVPEAFQAEQTHTHTHTQVTYINKYVFLGKISYTHAIKFIGFYLLFN
jgi:hypothetical protein